jgi:hypothetical protein
MVQGEKVSSVKSIKFLDLHLKSNLDWEDEINGLGNAQIRLKSRTV